MNSLRSKTKSGEPADGDTPYARMPIRMLGIDTLETNYGGGESTANAKLLNLKDFLSSGVFEKWGDESIGTRLMDRLENAGTLQISQGKKAKEFFSKALDERLTKPNGNKRRLFVRSADQHIDRYGRLLAYISPQCTGQELVNISDRDRLTFNLQHVESGRASTIMIYPSLPKNSDLRLTRESAKDAYDNKLGAWQDDKMLTPYEYRVCIKLFNQCKKTKKSEGYYMNESSWISRYCIDMTTLRVYNPQNT